MFQPSIPTEERNSSFSSARSLCPEQLAFSAGPGACAMGLLLGTGKGSLPRLLALGQPLRKPLWVADGEGAVVVALCPPSFCHEWVSALGLLPERGGRGRVKSELTCLPSTKLLLATVGCTDPCTPVSRVVYHYCGTIRSNVALRPHSNY